MFLGMHWLPVESALGSVDDSDGDLVGILESLRARFKMKRNFIK
jgi:hypothetical protein